MGVEDLSVPSGQSWRDQAVATILAFGGSIIIQLPATF
jgi:hypothetical protein